MCACIPSNKIFNRLPLSLSRSSFSAHLNKYINCFVSVKCLTKSLCSIQTGADQVCTTCLSIGIKKVERVVFLVVIPWAEATKVWQLQSRRKQNFITSLLGTFFINMCIWNVRKIDFENVSNGRKNAVNITSRLCEIPPFISATICPTSENISFSTKAVGKLVMIRCWTHNASWQNTISHTRSNSSFDWEMDVSSIHAAQ